MKTIYSILNVSALGFALMINFAPMKSHAQDAPSRADLTHVEIIEMADISIGLNGLVCDFCSIALNKTFKKRAEVRATYVDLDTKIMSIALNAGQTLSNTEIIKLVKNAGYSTTEISRKDGTKYTPNPNPNPKSESESESDGPKTAHSKD